MYSMIPGGKPEETPFGNDTPARTTSTVKPMRAICMKAGIEFTEEFRDLFNRKFSNFLNSLHTPRDDDAYSTLKRLMAGQSDDEEEEEDNGDRKNADDDDE